jgi:hypothetical protein
MALGNHNQLSESLKNDLGEVDEAMIHGDQRP